VFGLSVVLLLFLLQEIHVCLQLLAPAISLARGGFSMGAVAAHSIINPDLLQQPGFKETYADFETRPRIGDMFQNTDLAATLHQVLPASAVWHACLLILPHCCLFR
jgi:hypothetical protein